MRIYLVIFLTLTSFVAFAQTDILFSNTFNGGSLEDSNRGIQGQYSTRSAPTTTCGVVEDGLLLDGMNFVTYPAALNTLLDTSTYSISFYIRPTNRTSDIPQVIFSHRRTAERDSSFTVRYYGAQSEIVVEFAEDNSSVDELVAELDPDQCWYFVTILKTDNISTIFVGNTIEDQFTFIRPLILSDRATLKIADSPAIGSDFSRFEGVIDEFIIRNGLIEPLQLANLDLRVDGILSRDTTVFEGQSVDIQMGPSCADDITWQPSETLTDPMSLLPTASPDSTTTYLVEFDYGNCVSRDSIRIGIVGDEVSCDNLILPKAFTPNRDGLNDRYGISTAFLIEELISFDIFDKWGSKVFTTSNKEDMWDGTFNGRDLDPGMFLYKIRYICDGNELLNTGSFSLIN